MLANRHVFELTSEGEVHLTGSVCSPPSMKPGRPERVDYEDRRNGTTKPLEGEPCVKAPDNRVVADYARVLKDLMDTHSPEAEKTGLVQDNVNIHALYEAVFPGEARTRLLRGDYAPESGGWLNMTESDPPF